MFVPNFYFYSPSSDELGSTNVNGSGNILHKQQIKHICGIQLCEDLRLTYLHPCQTLLESNVCAIGHIYFLIFQKEDVHFSL